MDLSGRPRHHGSSADVHVVDSNALRTLEFDRIVDVLTGLALTPFGARAIAALVPDTDPKAVAAAINATTETSAFLEANPPFPLRAGSALEEAFAVLRV